MKEAPKPPRTFLEFVIDCNCNRRPPAIPNRIVSSKPSQCRAPPALGDARGEAPCNKITKITPFPAGEGGGGMGAGKQAKGRVDRRQRRRAPRRVLERQVEPATNRASSRWVSEWHGYSATNRASPRRVPPTPAEPVPRPTSPGNARGEAPCIK